MTRYIDPRAARPEEQVDHDYSLEITDESAQNYLQWIADRISPHLGLSVLEVGAGHGAVTRRIADGRRVLAVDLSESCVAALERRFSGSPNVRVEHGDARLAGEGETFDSLVMVNVLEHISDDVGALRSLGERLRSGATVVIYVPALDQLYSPYDRQVGHQRRYTKRRLRAVAEESGLDVVELAYMNLASLPAWFVFARLLKRDPAKGGGLSIWDRRVIPASRWVEERVRVPVGLNLIMVARRR